MSKVLIEEQTLHEIGAAIRNKSALSTTYKPGEMANAIRTTIPSASIIVDSLDYLTNTNYYIGMGDNGIASEWYYGSPIETVASFSLTVGKQYILSLDENPGNRFRYGMFDTRPFTTVPNPLPSSSTDSALIQNGITIFTGYNSTYYNGNDPNPYSAVAFTATKPYLGVFLGTSAAQIVNVYLVEL